MVRNRAFLRRFLVREKRVVCHLFPSSILHPLWLRLRRAAPSCGHPPTPPSAVVSESVGKLFPLRSLCYLLLNQPSLRDSSGGWTRPGVETPGYSHFVPSGQLSPNFRKALRLQTRLPSAISPALFYRRRRQRPRCWGRNLPGEQTRRLRPRHARGPCRCPPIPLTAAPDN